MLAPDMTEDQYREAWKASKASIPLRPTEGAMRLRIRRLMADGRERTAVDMVNALRTNEGSLRNCVARMKQDGELTMTTLERTRVYRLARQMAEAAE